MNAPNAPATPPKNHVCWFELYVDDMERARSFYEQVFAVNFTQMQMPGGALWQFDFNKDGYGATGALIKMDGMKPGGGGTMVYFTCADCAETQKAVEAAGGKVLKPKWSIGEYGNIAIVEDSEGNCIGLHSC